VRVFVVGHTAEDRRVLAERVAGNPRWLLVSNPALADLVVTSPEEWRRLERLRARGGTVTAEPPVEGLTDREREVLALVADGLHNREIGARLGVTEHTVKFHLAAVFGKLGASTRAEAVQKALRMGILTM
jgi:DNA-binding CsgD family transcriptional regulator